MFRQHILSFVCIFFIMHNIYVSGCVSPGMDYSRCFSCPSSQCYIAGRFSLLFMIFKHKHQSSMSCYSVIFIYKLPLQPWFSLTCTVQNSCVSTSSNSSYLYPNYEICVTYAMVLPFKVTSSLLTHTELSINSICYLLLYINFDFMIPYYLYCFQFIC